MNILVTAGATREPLDAVRFLSNVSTGSTGAALADALAAHNHRVTLLRGESAVAPRSACEVEVFTSTEDLRARLQRRLEGGTFDAVIMCAAVADYRPDFAVDGKISSAAAELTLRLVRNPKILPQLKSFSPRPLVVVGFKLTVGADAAAGRAAVAAQFAAGTVDAVVHNDLEEIRASSAHPFWLYRSTTAAPEQIGGAKALAEALDRLIATIMSARTKANSRSR
jgi:phosphopantothenoylcysteine decarboxylase/phosphopantothenate--cysteine ligase